ncbi:MAG: hypothetical protein WCM76_15965 [Bacteroidota bacterium]
MEKFNSRSMLRSLILVLEKLLTVCFYKPVFISTDYWIGNLSENKQTLNTALLKYQTTQSGNLFDDATPLVTSKAQPISR